MTCGLSRPAVSRIRSTDGFRDQPHIVAVDAEAARAQGDLLRRFLARHIERVHVGGQGGEHLQQQGGLADSRVAADQHHRARDQPAAQHAVEFQQADRGARMGIRPDRREAGHRDAGITGKAGEASAALRRHGATSASVFQAPQSPHCPAHWGNCAPQALQA